MKRIAFLQAVVLFVLLSAAWILLFNRLRQTPDANGEAVHPEPSNGTAQAAEQAAPPVAETQPDASLNTIAVIPQGWLEWIHYLEQQVSASAMRQALDELRGLLFALPADQAVARLMEILQSGVDLETGLTFRIRKAGELAGAGSFRAILLDWLAQLDPPAAARLARMQLELKGTRMHADEFVIHMRNVARQDPAESGGYHSFLLQAFRHMLDQDAWMQDPPAAVAEAMDIPVYLNTTELVPDLAGLTSQAAPAALRHASALALERLVDLAPLDTARLLLGSPEGKAMLPQTRAGLLARLNPGDATSQALLRDYLASPATSLPEADFFLRSFPNMNQSLSHNLLSPEFLATEAGGHEARLRSALLLLQEWQTDPALGSLGDVLEDSRERIRRQLTGNPLD